VVRQQQPAPVVPGRVLVRTVAGLRLIGIDVQPVLERIELRVEELGDQMIPLSRLQALLEAAVRSSGESGIGLRLAEQVRPETYEVFGCLLAASATLGEAVLRATRLISLATSNVRLSFHHAGDRASLNVEPLYPELIHREAVEFMLGASHVLARRITGLELAPLEVQFAHAAPPDTSHHERLFAAPLRFRCASNALVFDGSLLDVPVRSHDSSLSAALQHQAEQLILREPAVGFAAEVRAALAKELRGGEPTAARLAAALDVHPKTLARRLRNEGTTFRHLLDELRLQLAESYLRQPNLSVDEVAFLLGYSERSAFHRAFRRWTGRAPRAKPGAP
jgi:AraC-like DNA-binding protein